MAKSRHFSKDKKLKKSVFKKLRKLSFLIILVGFN